MKRILPVAWLALLMAGCASQPPAQHTMAQSTIAQSTTAQSPTTQPSTSTVERASHALASGSDAQPNCQMGLNVADPWEPFNRAVYNFNARFDEAIFLPVSRGYARILPRPVRSGVNNFFKNLGELGNIVNHGLQGRLSGSAHSLSRFLINTTIGIGGLFDPAKPLGLERMPTGFGHTLAHWGAGPGPYLVLPLAGPSSLRDGGGLLFDGAMSYSVNLGGLYQSDHAWAVGTTAAIDTRSNVNFRYYASGSPFEYDMVRFLYSNMRMIESGVDTAWSDCE